MSNKKKVAILGCTGSIGTSALDVMRKYKDELELYSATAHSSTDELKKIAAEFSPRFIAVSNKSRKADCDFGNVKTGFGAEALKEACSGADIVVMAIVGMAALPPFVYCLENDIPVALANKESMVCGARLIRDLMDERGSVVLPVDSETFAISECLRGRNKADVSSVLLTASGGPFRTWKKEDIDEATPDMALRHPNWSMGAKITVDCATMLNKGLEVMETRWLFDIEPACIRIVVHPESIIHSMVEYNDNAVIAHMAVSDMRLPIANALLYPNVPKVAVDKLDLFSIGSLHFEEPSRDRFPCLDLAYEAIKKEGALPIVLNSSNEIAVGRFLAGEFPLRGIAELIESAMCRFGGESVSSFEDIYALDREVRKFVVSVKIRR